MIFFIFSLQRSFTQFLSQPPNFEMRHLWFGSIFFLNCFHYSAFYKQSSSKSLEHDDRLVFDWMSNTWFESLLLTKLLVQIWTPRIIWINRIHYSYGYKKLLSIIFETIIRLFCLEWMCMKYQRWWKANSLM